MSSKDVESYDLFRESKESPIPDRWVLSFETSDGWFYRYVSQRKGEPFEFKHKRRPDATISDDDVTPRSVRDFFESSPLFELVDEKLLFLGEYPE